jgi:hypothetical protein
MPELPHRVLVLCGGLALVVSGALAPAGCARRSPSASPLGDASARREVPVRVPAALSIARAYDSISVSIDPTSLASTTVMADDGMFLGVETECYVFPVGQPRPAEGRHRLGSGTDFEVGTSTWNASEDGIPVPGIRYVAEMQITLFETDAAPGGTWDPRNGRYESLWTRTLRQAEE